MLNHVKPVSRFIIYFLLWPWPVTFQTFWNLRYTSHLQLQGQKCVEEIGFGIQARKWRHFSCLPLNLEARQHCPSRDWWWEDLRRFHEGGLGAFGPQGQVGWLLALWTYSIECVWVREIPELNVESCSILEAWKPCLDLESMTTVLANNAYLTCSRFCEVVFNVTCMYDCFEHTHTHRYDG